MTATSRGEASRGEALEGVVRLRASPRAAVAPTDVLFGTGALSALRTAIADAFPRAARRLVVADEALADPAVRAAWSEATLAGDDVVLVPAGEAAKTRAVHARLEDELLRRGLTRDDPVVAIGGGAALDAVGFAAATTRRGLPWVAVPTSVVGIADASIGGKTAIDHPIGKNLLGAFHPPRLVVSDPATLVSLPRRDRVAGLAEVWKAGVVGDPALLDGARAGPPSDAALPALLLRAIRVKLALVEEDPLDTGVRRALNYGHTVGHALETLLGPDAIRHGEGVAIGMGVAGECAVRRGLLDRRFVDAQDRALRALGLPVALPASAAIEAVVELVASDKKRRAGALHAMVLPIEGGGVRIVEDVERAELVAALVARREVPGRSP